MARKKADGPRSTKLGPRPGELIIIGGHEEKEGPQEKEILKLVAERVNGGNLVVATLASTEAVEQWKTYREVFHRLGVKKVERLDVETRAETADDERAELIRRARLIFF